jgi:hypothetical protein
MASIRFDLKVSPPQTISNLSSRAKDTIRTLAHVKALLAAQLSDLIHSIG